MKTLINPTPFRTGGGIHTTLGRCALCGRMLGAGKLNKIGARCSFEGAQYDRTGALLWDAATEQSLIGARKRIARKTYSVEPLARVPALPPVMVAAMDKAEGGAK